MPNDNLTEEEKFLLTLKNPNGLDKRLLNDFNNLGRESVNASFPNEIEYYACALELIDQNGTTIEFFSFPVMPSSLTENKQTITNIKKTNAGVVITTHPTFVPFDININGNFGRMFRRISNGPEKDYDVKKGATGTKLDEVVISNVFSTEFKTGYGCIKILEKIFNLSKTADKFSNPLRLLFYNLSLNSNYMVEAMNLQISQGKESSNMIWNYSLSMKAVSPIISVLDGKLMKSSMKELRSFSKKNMRMNEQSRAIEDIIGKDTKLKKLIRNLQGNELTNSAYQLLISRTQNSIENNDFLAKIGKNITLNRI